MGRSAEPDLTIGILARADPTWPYKAARSNSTKQGYKHNRQMETVSSKTKDGPLKKKRLGCALSRTSAQLRKEMGIICADKNTSIREMQLSPMRIKSS